MIGDPVLSLAALVHPRMQKAPGADDVGDVPFDHETLVIVRQRVVHARRDFVHHELLTFAARQRERGDHGGEVVVAPSGDGGRAIRIARGAHAR